jgi:phenylpropionate dioxygenase-like ring-hydroxylating dioxygenase large terminal subunit
MFTDLTELDKRLVSLVYDDRVSSRIYTEAAIFELELDRIWYKTWVYVGHESEIPTPGSYKTTTIGRQPVIVNRANDERVHVMYNRCRHRAATVCEEKFGTTKYFRCPYHGWTYGGDGTLLGVPFEEGYGEGVDIKPDRGLVHVARVESYRGFIFASLSHDGPSLVEHLGNAAPYLDIIAAQDLQVRSGVQRYPYNGNWKLQQENSVDHYHAMIVHKIYFDVLTKRAGNRIDVIGHPGWKSRDLGNGHACLDFSSGGLAVRVGDVPFNLQVFPNLTFIGVQIRVTSPLAVNRTLVEIHPTLSKKATAEENSQRLRMHEDFYGPAGFGSPDDVDVVMRRVPNGMAADRGDEWIFLDKGMQREEVDPETGVRSGEITDEGPQRGIYRAWRDHMLGLGGAAGMCELPSLAGGRREC